MRAFGFVIAIAFGSSAHALDTLDSQELLALCQSEKQAEVAVCTGYINGFLDGAFATDPRVAENVVTEMGRGETFSDRAIRTRLGITLERYGPSYYAGFCLPADLSTDTLLAELRDAATEEAVDPGQHNARDYLYRLLQLKHPCQTSRE
jgi:hypothetical protein